MRAVFTIPLLLLIALPGFARCDPPSEANPSAATERNEANWADWDAQARMTEGDYDGAVQAEQQAEADRDKAAREEQVAREPKRD